jgi:hypothetical protein
MAYLARLLDETALPGFFAAQIGPGDIVRRGENHHPHYRVIATSGHRAWVRDVQYGTDHVVELQDFHRI